MHAETSNAHRSLPQETRLWNALSGVMDPEIPVLSIVDMGMIAEARIDDAGARVKMLPTFAGCPALDLIQTNIRAALIAAGFDAPRVDVVFDPPWTSDRISETGRRKLKEFGLAPPARACGGISEETLADVACPYCDSRDTSMESIFGPTLCRSIHYCNACRQSFEQFKPVT